MQAVKMYTTAVCPYCIRAKQILKSKGVEQIEEIRIDSDPQARATMMDITQRRTVPQIFIGDTHVGGCDDLMRWTARRPVPLCRAPEPSGDRDNRATSAALWDIPGGHCFDTRKFSMADQQAQDPVFQIQRVYLKDLSLEQPNSPAILLEQEQPTVDIQLGVDAQPVTDGIFEITVSATVQTKI